MTVKEVFDDMMQFQKVLRIWRVDKVVTFFVGIFKPSNVLKLREEFPNLIGRCFFGTERT